MDHCGQFAAPAAGSCSPELSDLAPHNSCAWNSGGSLVEEFVDVIGWLEVWVRDIQEADERGQKGLQTGTATDLSSKVGLLILAAAWLDLTEQTTQTLDHEADEARRFIEQPT
jgi:hypothetical protein